MILVAALRARPALCAALFSLLLSGLAWQAALDPGRDGMIYLRAAQAYIDGGLAAAHAAFNWPFLSVLMALLARGSGLSLELAAYLLNALFMAACCALLVACVRQRSPALASWAVLVVLAVPGLNEYRGELIREFGSWCFSLLACWLALGSPAGTGPGAGSGGSWARAVAIQLAVLLAALFRPEAVVLLPALLAWEFFARRGWARWRALLQLSLLPLLALTVLALLLGSGGVQPDQDWLSRLTTDASRLSARGFDDKAQALASALLKYAQDEAASILFFGSLALVPQKIISKLGFFVLPLLWLLLRGPWQIVARAHALFVWAIAAHLLVLAVFVLDLQFLSGRYVGPVLLFATPFMAAGLQHWAAGRSLRRRALVAGAAVLALANVLSFSAPKTQYRDAGRWLRAEVGDSGARVFTDSARAAYHAGWLRLAPVEPPASPAAVRAALASADYDLAVLEVSHRDPAALAWLRGSGLQLIARFGAEGESGVVVIAR